LLLLSSFGWIGFLKARCFIDLSFGTRVRRIVVLRLAFRLRRRGSFDWAMNNPASQGEEIV